MTPNNNEDETKDNIILKDKKDISTWLEQAKEKQLQRFNKLKLKDKIFEWIDDKWSDIWYGYLFGRHIEEFSYKVKQFIVSIHHYNQGFGFTSNLDIWDFNHSTARVICNRLRLLRHKIIMGETTNIWDSLIDRVEKNMGSNHLGYGIHLLNLEGNENDYSKFLPILDTMSFAFDYIADPDKYMEDLFKELYGYEKYGWIHNDENKPETFDADWSNFHFGKDGVPPGIQPLEDKKQKGLELFIKYLEYLWD
jgi:hypothetical protein